MSNVVVAAALLVWGSMSLLAQLTSDFTPPMGAIRTMGREDDGAWQKRLMIARSEDGLHFERTHTIITDQANVPDLVKDGEGRLYLYYSGGTVGERSNVIAVAISEDEGASWVFKYVDIAGAERMPNPNDPDVRILPDGTFRLYFTSAEPGSRVPAIFYADGTDGMHFEFRGVAFRQAEQPTLDSFTVPIGDTWHMYTLGRTLDALPHAVSKDGENFALLELARFEANARLYIPTNELVLEDGTVRFYAFRPGPGGDIRSFLTEDGFQWEEEEGVRLALDTESGLEKSFVKDVAVIQLSDGSYLMVYCTVIPE
jgi:hypothetical protein